MIELAKIGIGGHLVSIKLGNMIRTWGIIKTSSIIFGIIPISLSTVTKNGDILWSETEFGEIGRRDFNNFSAIIVDTLKDEFGMAIIVISAGKID